MMEELLAAAAIGASFGNAWTCALVSLGCALDSKRGGVSFVTGRFIGLILLGMAVSLLGLAGNVSGSFFQILFGAFTVLLGVLVLIQVMGKRHRWLNRLLHFPLVHKKGRHGEHERELMADGGEVLEEKSSNPKIMYIFLLGILRGATPCLKVMVLAPLLISVDFGLAMLMVLVFAAASTIYPVIGFLSGNIIRQSRKHTRHLRLFASVMMIVLGIYFVVSALGGPGH